MNLFGKDLTKDIAIIAEIGVNHEGDYAQAEKMLRMAAQAGADAVKFQSYTSMRFVGSRDPDRLAQVEGRALSLEQFQSLAKLADELGVSFISTPVTEDWIEKLNPFVPAFKIASGDITFEPVIRAAAKTGKPVIISTGSATLEEVDQAVSWMKDEVGENNLKDRLIIMQCICAYPTPVEQANVRTVPFFKERYGLFTGYSNHIIGMNAALAAVAVGADVIEVHFTDQKEGRDFRDHSLSFDEKDLGEFVACARDIRSALGSQEKTIQPCELDPALVRKGIIAAHDLEAGSVLTEADLMFARPADEIPSGEISSLIGKTLNASYKKGEQIKRGDVQGLTAKAA